MIIRIEPKDFFMSTILLLFDQGHPDPEDEEVKRYLAERALERLFAAAIRSASLEEFQAAMTQT
jgi:hypothetical protein